MTTTENTTTTPRLSLAREALRALTAEELHLVARGRSRTGKCAV